MMEPDTVELLKNNKGQVISPNKNKKKNKHSNKNELSRLKN